MTEQDTVGANEGEMGSTQGAERRGGVVREGLSKAVRLDPGLEGQWVFARHDEGAWAGLGQRLLLTPAAVLVQGAGSSVPDSECGHSLEGLLFSNVPGPCGCGIWVFPAP